MTGDTSFHRALICRRNLMKECKQTLLTHLFISIPRHETRTPKGKENDQNTNNFNFKNLSHINNLSQQSSRTYGPDLYFQTPEGALVTFNCEAYGKGCRFRTSRSAVLCKRCFLGCANSFKWQLMQLTSLIICIMNGSIDLPSPLSSPSPPV